MHNRILQVLEAASSAHSELRSFMEVASQGLGWASEAKRIHELMAKNEAFASDPAALESHRNRAEAAEEFAKAQRPLGFPYLWYLASVRLWTIVEVAVEDVVCEFLAVPERLPNDSVVRRLEAPVLAFQALEPGEKAEALLQLLKDKTRSVLQTGSGKLESLLEPVGLGGGVPDSVRRAILELSQVRNLTVHKNAVVDRRFRERCPWVACDLGDLLPISGRHLGLYGLAVDWYTLELELRVDAVLGSNPDPESLELRDKLSTHVAQFSKMLHPEQRTSGGAA